MIGALFTIHQCSSILHHYATETNYSNYVHHYATETNYSNYDCYLNSSSIKSKNNDETGVICYRNVSTSSENIEPSETLKPTIKHIVQQTTTQKIENKKQTYYTQNSEFKTSEILIALTVLLLFITGIIMLTL